MAARGQKVATLPLKRNWRIDPISYGPGNRTGMTEGTILTSYSSLAMMKGVLFAGGGLKVSRRCKTRSSR